MVLLPPVDLSLLKLALPHPWRMPVGPCCRCCRPAPAPGLRKTMPRGFVEAAIRGARHDPPAPLIAGTVYRPRWAEMAEAYCLYPAGRRRAAAVRASAPLPGSPGHRPPVLRCPPDRADLRGAHRHHLDLGTGAACGSSPTAAPPALPRAACRRLRGERFNRRFGGCVFVIVSIVERPHDAECCGVDLLGPHRKRQLMNRTSNSNSLASPCRVADRLAHMAGRCQGADLSALSEALPDPVPSLKTTPSRSAFGSGRFNTSVASTVRSRSSENALIGASYGPTSTSWCCL